MTHTKPSDQAKHVYIVDDDNGIRTALGRGLGRLGYDVHQFAAGELFLNGALVFRPAVLVVDMQMPGISGVQLQARLKDKGWNFPVIFISGESSVLQTITAMKQGALDFLVKPFDLDRLTALISAGIEQDRAQLQAQAQQALCQKRLKQLTPRELETFYYLAKGYSSSELMSALDISQPTAKQYRAAIMRKLEFSTLAELIEFHAALTAG